jgi:transcriptional activator HAC1
MSTDFKSALPPRKRAKTKEEKEQRRVERILRNRRAAHASREKKRKHVEYLESYVLKLEANLEKLQANFQAVVGLLDLQALEKANLVELDDIAHLKDQVHSNLNGAGCNGSTSPEDGDDDDEADVKLEDNFSTASATPSKKRKLEQTPEAISSEVAPNTVDISPPSWVVEKNKEHESCFNTTATKSKDEFLTVASENGSFYNYLSPISMGSPMNSPIDLKLETEGPEQQQPSMLDTTTFSQDLDLTKGFNSMGQSSEETLLPRSYDSLTLSIPC